MDKMGYTARTTAQTGYSECRDWGKDFNPYDQQSNPQPLFLLTTRATLEMLHDRSMLKNSIWPSGWHSKSGVQPDILL